MATVERKIYSVRELTEKIKALLEETYPFIWIQGEISNFKVPASSHYYFTLKDEFAQISAVMFRGQNKKLKFLPEDGMHVTGFGRLSVYSPRGTYQIILEYLEPVGVGALQAAFEQLKTKLSEEGLFDPAFKKPLPLLPQKICLITSATGSVVHDMIRVMNRRFPNIHLEILPVSVQGDRAVLDIVSALTLLNMRQDADLAILARGGGSLEDLWPFNSEEVARAIFASNIPVVSAVGHETDYTISDFVADLRAPTPSAAAEIAVPVKTELLERRAQLNRQLTAAFLRMIREQHRHIRQLTDRLVHPKRRLDDLRLRLDELSERLYGAFQRELRQQKERLEWRRRRLSNNNPRLLIQTRKIEISRLTDQICAAMEALLHTKGLHLRALHAQLNALSPAAVLERGYSITRRLTDAIAASDRQASIIKNAASVDIGDRLEVLLAKGQLICSVEDKKNDG